MVQTRGRMKAGKYRLRTAAQYLKDAAAHHKIQKRRRESTLATFISQIPRGMIAGCPKLDLWIDAPQYVQGSRDLKLADINWGFAAVSRILASREYPESLAADLFLLIPLRSIPYFVRYRAMLSHVT